VNEDREEEALSPPPPPLSYVEAHVESHNIQDVETAVK